MAIDKITDHGNRAIGRLLTQFSGSASHKALLSAVGKQVQAAEDALYDVLLARGIDFAQGVHLDNLGEIVGQAREGRDDPTYRKWIRARILVNRRSGEVETLAQIVNLLVPGSVARIKTFAPAAIEVTIDNAIVTDADAIQFDKLLQLAKAAGVKLVMIYRPQATSSTFTLDAAGLGMGDTGNPATGGKLAGALS